MNLLLEQYNLLNKEQHWFFKSKSRTTAPIALVQLTAHLLDLLDGGCTATCLIIYFNKAFDCLNHELLLKVKNLGVRGRTAHWLNSYLSNRIQLVEITYVKNNKRWKAYSKAAERRR